MESDEWMVLHINSYKSILVVNVQFVWVDDENKEPVSNASRVIFLLQVLKSTLLW